MSEPEKTARNKLIRARVAAGESASSVARELGVSRQRIHQLLHPEVKTPTPRTPTAASAVEIVTLYEEGLSIAAVSHLTGASESKVRYQLYRAGVEMRRRGTTSMLSAPRRQQIRAEYAAGATKAELARRHSCSVPTITRAIVDDYVD